MFLIAPQLIFLLGIVGVGLANQSLPFAMALLAAYAAGLDRTYRRDRSIRKSTETVLAVLGVAAALLYAAYLGQHALFSLQYWLALMLVIRAFRRMEARDYGFCFLISAALFAHVGRSYEDLPFLFLALAAVGAAPYALFSYLARYGGFQKSALAPAAAGLRFSAAQFRFMTGLSVALLATSTAIFLVLPRAGGSSVFGTISANPDKKTTGLTDQVPLGSFSEILPRSTIVMTAATDRPALWRVGVLDYYEKGIWYSAVNNPGQRTALPAPKPGVASTRRIFEIFDVRLTGFRLATSGTILSFIPLTDGWKTWRNNRYATIHVVQTDRGSVYRGRYELVSREAEFIGPPALSAGRWLLPTAPARRMDENELCLQVPPDVSTRVRNLALDITRGLTSEEEQANAVQRYLAQGYAYSLKGLNSGGMQPLDYFLFKAKAGHCEYFASSMAILLRCAGVRTRVVQGFAPGALDGGLYVARLSDAHMWTEVFFPGQGWKAYDPTPGRTERLFSGQSLSLLERLKLRWESNVLNYDRSMQAALFAQLRRIVAEAIDALKRRPSSVALALAALLLLGAVLALFRFRGLFPRLRWPFRRAGDTHAALGRVRNTFGRYLKELARKGYQRGPATTPNDLLAALQRDHAPIMDEAALLTRLFYETRFGNGQLSPKLDAETKRALRRIRNWTR